MRKLTDVEERALKALAEYPGGFCPGDAAKTDLGERIMPLLKALVRKGRATVEEFDDGPVFRITAADRGEAAFLESAGA